MMKSPEEEMEMIMVNQLEEEDLCFDHIGYLLMRETRTDFESDEDFQMHFSCILRDSEIGFELEDLISKNLNLYDQREFRIENKVRLDELVCEKDRMMHELVTENQEPDLLRLEEKKKKLDRVHDLQQQLLERLKSVLEADEEIDADEKIDKEPSLNVKKARDQLKTLEHLKELFDGYEKVYNLQKQLLKLIPLEAEEEEKKKLLLLQTDDEGGKIVAEEEEEEGKRNFEEDQDLLREQQQELQALDEERKNYIRKGKLKVVEGKISNNNIAEEDLDRKHLKAILRLSRQTAQIEQVGAMGASSSSSAPAPMPAETSSAGRLSRVAQIEQASSSSAPAPPMSDHVQAATSSADIDDDYSEWYATIQCMVDKLLDDDDTDHHIRAQPPARHDTPYLRAALLPPIATRSAPRTAAAAAAPPYDTRHHRQTNSPPTNPFINHDSRNLDRRQRERKWRSTKHGRR